MRIVKALTDVGVETIHSKFFTDGQPDNDKIKAYIQTIVKNNGLGASAEDIIKEADGVAAGIASRRVFENSVTSIVNAEVVDIETTGGTAIQQSSFGFVGYGSQNVSSQSGAYKINYNRGKEL